MSSVSSRCNRFTVCTRRADNIAVGQQPQRDQLLIERERG
jgi:hypothetical protein